MGWDYLSDGASGDVWAATLPTNPTHQIFIGDVPAPEVVSVSAPNVGTGAGSMHLYGFNLSQVELVTFNGVAGSLVNVSSEDLEINYPAGPPGEVTIRVVANAQRPFTVTPTMLTRHAPVVTSVSPDSGSVSGGTSITISGQYFHPSATITIGGTVVTDRTWIDANTFTCSTPAGTAGDKTVRVTNPDGYYGEKLNAFTYTGSTTPVLASLDFDQADTGDSITITGSDLGSASSCTVGGTSATISSNTATSITFVMPAKSAGVHDVQVTTASGASNTLALEAWNPTVDPNVTLLFDAKYSAYDPMAAGGAVWWPRYSAPTVDSPAEKMTMMAFSTTNQPVSGGAPVFDGDGAGEGGLEQQTGAWAIKYLESDGGSPEHTPGSTFGVFSFTNVQTMTTGADIWTDPFVIATGSSTHAITAGLRSADEEPILRTHIWSSADGYRGCEVEASQGDLHAVVSRWSNSTGGSIDLSVDGALSGPGYDSFPTSAGLQTDYLAHHFKLGVSYPENAVTVQKYAGIIPAWGVMKAKASDAFVTKFNKWRSARWP